MPAVSNQAYPEVGFIVKFQPRAMTHNIPMIRRDPEILRFTLLLIIFRDLSKLNIRLIKDHIGQDAQGFHADSPLLCRLLTQCHNRQFLQDNSIH